MLSGLWVFALLLFRVRKCQHDFRLRKIKHLHMNWRMFPILGGVIKYLYVFSSRCLADFMLRHVCMNVCM